MGSSTISLGLGLGVGKSGTSSGRSPGGGGFNALSLEFDGGDTEAIVTASLVSKTISIWMKPDSTINASTSKACILGFNDVEAGVYVGAGTNQLTNEIIYATDGYRYWGYESASASLSSSAWHHICLTWQTSNSSTNSGNPGYDIYLNATKVGNGFGNFGIYGNGNYITSTYVAQGRGGATNGAKQGFFAGFLDEAAIWNVSLSAADITSIYNSGVPNDLTDSSSYNTDRTSGLIGYWRNGDGTEGGSGDTIYDMSSNSNNMSLLNDPSYSSDVPS